MQKKLTHEEVKQFLPNRFTQISESHCGPAVLQMLLANIGIVATQEEITKQAGAEKTIETHGTRIDQLAKATHQISKTAQFWYKEHSSIDDIKILINEFKFPVAVEWQGLFEVGGFNVSEEGAEDYGHYSIVSYVDESKLIIVDPYKDFASQDRIFTIKQFLPRWWDYNEIIDPTSGEKYIKKDEQMLFVVTLREMQFPEKLGMNKYF